MEGGRGGKEPRSALAASRRILRCARTFPLWGEQTSRCSSTPIVHTHASDEGTMTERTLTPTEIAQFTHFFQRDEVYLAP